MAGPNSSGYVALGEDSSPPSLLATSWRKVSTFLNAYAGILLALASGVLLTAYTALYQTIKDDIARITILLLRGSIQFFGLVALAKCLGNSFVRSSFQPPEAETAAQKCTFWTVFCIAISIGGLRINALFAALQLSPITIVNTLMAGSPVVVMIFSHFCLNKGDPFTVVKISASVLLITGVLLNANPFPAVKRAMSAADLQTVAGLTLSFASLLLSALGSVFNKMITARIDKLYISGFMGASIFLGSLCTFSTDEFFLEIQLAKAHNITLRGTNITVEVCNGAGAYPPNTNMTCLYNAAVDDHGVFNESALNATQNIEHCQVGVPPYLPTSPSVWLMALVVGVVGITQQFCLIAAIKRDTPSRVTMIRSVSVILSFLVDIFCNLGEPLPTWNEWLGAFLILGAIFLVTMNDLVVKLGKIAKRRLCCCLFRNGGEEEEEEGEGTALLNPPG